MGGSQVKQLRQYPGENERVSRSRENVTVEQIKKKLVGAYPDLAKKPNELDDLAKTLADSEKVKERYFKQLYAKMKEAEVFVKEEREDLGGRIANKATRDDYVERLDGVMTPVRELKVKLVLCEINSNPLKANLARFCNDVIHKFKFGPFHAAIHIDDIVLEWGPDSLIIPKKVEKPLHEASVDDANTLLVTDLHPNNTAPPQEVFNEGRSTDEAFKQTIQEAIDLTKEKECLINELADLVVRYNTKFHYGLLSNNCQHFVIDVLSVLGITDHMEAFKGKLKAHAELLMMRKDAVAEFNSHKELDDYVRENIDRMTIDDIQFCYCSYLLFHAWEVRRPKERAWKCTQEQCLSQTLAGRLNIN